MVEERQCQKKRRWKWRQRPLKPQRKKKRPFWQLPEQDRRRWKPARPEEKNFLLEKEMTLAVR